MATTDFLVLGNGILGMMVATELMQRDPGLSVTVVGPSDRLGSASVAAGAMLGCFSEVTQNLRTSAASQARLTLSLAARDRWVKFSRFLIETSGTDDEPPLHMVSGTHVLLNNHVGTVGKSNFTAMITALEERGEPWEEVDPSEIPGLAPMEPACILRAVYIPNESAVDAGQVMRLLERHLQRSGVQLVNAHTLCLVHGESRVSKVRLSDGTVYSASVIVVAAGSWTAEILRTVLPADRVMPIFSGTGVAFVGQRASGTPFTTVVRTPVRSGGCGLHLVPLAGGLEYIGASNDLFTHAQLIPHIGAERSVTTQAIEQLDQRIYYHRVREWRIGNRPISLDSFPLVGWHDIDGLYVLSGTYRNGFHCAPALAEHAAVEMMTGRKTFDLPFDPARCPIESRSREEAIDDCIAHSVSSWFEAGGRLPEFMSDESLRTFVLPHAQAIYENIGFDIGLEPEILTYLARSDGARSLEVVRNYLRQWL